MRLFFLALGALWLSACVTTHEPQAPIESEPVIVQPKPMDPVEPSQPDLTPPDTSTPDTNEAVTPLPPIVIRTPDPSDTSSRSGTGLPSIFDSLKNWASADMRPSLAAFKRQCELWMTRDPLQELQKGHPQYGRIIDWYSACDLARAAGDSMSEARAFFENAFMPVYFQGSESGLLTAYYQPEISVSSYPTKEFREPILAVPSDPKTQSLPRENISAASAQVIAFGRPIDVFFMQIQGSGVLAFPDGTKRRASYAANNGYRYVSIGKVLIDRGELTRDTASKDSIEAWMKAAGPVKARALMNENPRYIFFKDEVIIPGEGPKGAGRLPLTAMGSLAIDPKYYPYGLPVWLETKLPQQAGDYRGIETGLLVVAQDTGNAIRGASRGDIYFGSGQDAGARAGVMKHPGRWTLMLPVSLALTFSPVS